eukprot:gene5065-34860_t
MSKRGKKVAQKRLDASSSEGKGDEGVSEDSWVQCDRCNKWRNIPTVVAEKLDDKLPWYCEHNPNKEFASCSVPQGLTNEEIDNLGESSGGEEQEEEEEEEEVLHEEDERQQRKRIPAVWQLIHSNAIMHRKRKVQDEDDVMICNCNPPWRRGDGCGPGCINRMLCIECSPGFCPSEDMCTNQAFSRRQYADLEVRRAGAKGFGLFSNKAVKAGQFLIEYIGEALEEDEYQRRKSFYQAVGQRHYYFMNVGNGEVIDACRKGNNARFINHSCSPNCETQKWLVKGELAIGLFATKDLAANEELTFDYNFERYSDKPMRCYCNSATCRQFVGGGTQDIPEGQAPKAVTAPVTVTEEDASGDLPPIMVGCEDMDHHIQAILDWRVGTPFGMAPRRDASLTRLSQICEARTVEWKPSDFASDYDPNAPMLSEPDSDRSHSDLQAANGIADMDLADDSNAVGPCVGHVDRTHSKDHLKRASDETRHGEAAMFCGHKPVASGKASSSRALMVEQQALMLEQHLQLRKGSQQSGSAAGKSAPKDASATSDEKTTQFRGPLKMAFKMKMSQQITSTPATEIPVAKPRCLVPKENAPKGLFDNVELLRKRLKQGGDARGRPKPSSRGTATDAKVTSSGSSRCLSDGTGGTGGWEKYSGGTRLKGDLSHAAPQSRKRSEIDRRLDSLIGPSGRLKDASHMNIINVLRMFNLCDMGQGCPSGASNTSTLPSKPEPDAATPRPKGLIAAMKEEAAAAAAAAGERGTIPPTPGDPPPGTSGRPDENMAMTGRQRARMADLSLLLDIVLRTSSATVRKEFVSCGLLNQLHQAIGRNFSRTFSVILRKLLRVVETLPLTANDVHSVRSAHGTFVQVLHELTQNVDFDVRTKSAALLKKYPASACSDPSLLQPHPQHNNRFGARAPNPGLLANPPPPAHGPAAGARGEGFGGPSPTPSSAGPYSGAAYGPGGGPGFERRFGPGGGAGYGMGSGVYGTSFRTSGGTPGPFDPTRPSGGTPGPYDQTRPNGGTPGPYDPPRPSGGTPSPYNPTRPNGGTPGPYDQTRSSGGTPGPYDPTRPSGGTPGPYDPTRPNGGTPGPYDPTRSSGGTPSPYNPTRPSGGTPGPYDPTRPNGGTPGPYDPARPNGGVATGPYAAGYGPPGPPGHGPAPYVGTLAPYCPGTPASAYSEGKLLGILRPLERPMPHSVHGQQMHAPMHGMDMAMMDAHMGDAHMHTDMGGMHPDTSARHISHMAAAHGATVSACQPEHVMMLQSADPAGIAAADMISAGQYSSTVAEGGNPGPPGAASNPYAALPAAPTPEGGAGCTTPGSALPPKYRSGKQMRANSMRTDGATPEPSAYTPADNANNNFPMPPGYEHTGRLGSYQPASPRKLSDGSSYQPASPRKLGDGTSYQPASPCKLSDSSSYQPASPRKLSESSSCPQAPTLPPPTTAPSVSENGNHPPPALDTSMQPEAETSRNTDSKPPISPAVQRKVKRPKWDVVDPKLLEARKLEAQEGVAPVAAAYINPQLPPGFHGLFGVSSSKQEGLPPPPPPLPTEQRTNVAVIRLEPPPQHTPSILAPSPTPALTNQPRTSSAVDRLPKLLSVEQLFQTLELSATNALNPMAESDGKATIADARGRVADSSTRAGKGGQAQVADVEHSNGMGMSHEWESNGDGGASMREKKEGAAKKLTLFVSAATETYSPTRPETSERKASKAEPSSSMYSLEDALDASVAQPVPSQAPPAASVAPPPPSYPLPPYSMPALVYSMPAVVDLRSSRAPRKVPDASPPSQQHAAFPSTAPVSAMEVTGLRYLPPPPAPHASGSSLPPPPPGPPLLHASGSSLPPPPGPHKTGSSLPPPPAPHNSGPSLPPPPAPHNSGSSLPPPPAPHTSGCNLPPPPAPPAPHLSGSSLPPPPPGPHAFLSSCSSLPLHMRGHEQYDNRSGAPASHSSLNSCSSLTLRKRASDQHDDWSGAPAPLASCSSLPLNKRGTEQYDNWSGVPASHASPYHHTRAPEGGSNITRPPLPSHTSPYQNSHSPFWSGHSPPVRDLRDAQAASPSPQLPSSGHSSDPHASSRHPPTSHPSPMHPPHASASHHSPMHPPHAQSSHHSPMHPPHAPSSHHSPMHPPHAPSSHHSPMQLPHPPASYHSPMQLPYQPASHHSPMQLHMPPMNNVGHGHNSYGPNGWPSSALSSLYRSSSNPVISQHGGTAAPSGNPPEHAATHLGEAHPGLPSGKWRGRLSSPVSPSHPPGAGAAAAASVQMPPVASLSSWARKGSTIDLAGSQPEMWALPVSTNHAETWDEPNAAFERYVWEMVRFRLGKYVQPNHPNHISKDGAEGLLTKMKHEVVEKERRSCEDRKLKGAGAKLIERRKLEGNIKEYVRQSIRRYHGIKSSVPMHQLKTQTLGFLGSPTGKVTSAVAIVLLVIETSVLLSLWLSSNSDISPPKKYFLTKRAVAVGIAADSGCGKSTFMARVASTLSGFDKLKKPKGILDSNSLVGDVTTVLCLDDYHCLDRSGRKAKRVTALNPQAQNFDLMYEQHSLVDKSTLSTVVCLDDYHYLETSVLLSY